jgi:hypothetical protein
MCGHFLALRLSFLAEELPGILLVAQLRLRLVVVLNRGVALQRLAQLWSWGVGYGIRSWGQ